MFTGINITMVAATDLAGAADKVLAKAGRLMSGLAPGLDRAIADLEKSEDIPPEILRIIVR